MIIVEGMDNTGKSKLANYLGDKFHLPVVCRPKDKTRIVEDTVELLLLNPVAVMDRFPVISERVYGPILRGKIAFDGDITIWQFFFDKLVDCHPLVIYCRPPDEKVFDFGDRKQMEGIVERRLELLDTYDTVINSWTIQLWIIKYDFTVSDARSFVDFAVKAYLLRRRAN